VPETTSSSQKTGITNVPNPVITGNIAGSPISARRHYWLWLGHEHLEIFFDIHAGYERGPHAYPVPATVTLAVGDMEMGIHGRQDLHSVLLQLMMLLLGMSITIFMMLQWYFCDGWPLPPPIL
jgi:hypothetical protein